MRPRVLSLIRQEPHYRRDAFVAAFESLGYEVHLRQVGLGLGPRPDDVLLIWNRYGTFAQVASQFSAVGARVIVAENGVLGRDRVGGPWYSLALDFPAMVGGRFCAGGPERFASWGVNICDWRNGGQEAIVLAQRGIGPPGFAEPPGWHQEIARMLKNSGARVRIRKHPGESQATAIEDDIGNAHSAITWGSGAALKALIFGVPVLYGLKTWCGARAGRFLFSSIDAQSRTCAEDRRREVLERLAWSTFTPAEIATGEPIRNLLTLPYIAHETSAARA